MANPVQYQPDVQIDTGAVDRRVGRVTTPPLDNTGAAMAAFGGSLDNLGSSLQVNANRVQLLQDQDAEREAHVTAAKTAANVYQQFADAQDAQGDNPAGFTPKFMAQFDDYTKGIVDATPNLRAQQVLRANFAGLALHMQEKAMGWEAAQNVEYKGQQIEDSTAAYARVLAGDDSAYAAVRDGVYRQIEGSGLPLRIRDTYREKADKALTTAAWTGFTLRNPYAAQRVANDALGIAPPSTISVGPVSRLDETLPAGWTQDMMRAAAMSAQADGKTEFAVNMNTKDANGQAVMGNVRVADVLNPQTPTQMVAGMSSSLTNVAPSSPVTEQPSSVNVPKDAPPWMERMTPQDMVAMKTHADGEVQKLQGDAQAKIRLAMTDAAKAAELGMTPTIPGQDEFVAAYGKNVGTQHYNSAAQIQQTGQLVGSMRSMQPEQLAEQQKAAYAKIGAPGSQPGDISVAAHNAALIDSAITTIIKQRDADPITAAGAQGIAPVQPINWQDTGAALAELSNRQGVAIKMKESYAAGNYSALTAGDAQGLRQAWSTAAPSAKMLMLSQMRTALTDDRVYRATIQAIKPDSPVVGAVGSLLLKTTPLNYGGGWFSDGSQLTPQNASETFLRGDDVLNPTKAQKAEDGRPGRPLVLPKEQDLRDVWTSQVGNAFRGNEQGEAVAYQLYRTFYAGKLAELGDVSGNINTNAAKLAVNAATGGLYDWNGGKAQNDSTLRAADAGKVAKPWGMDDARFLDDVTAAYTTAAASAGYKLPPLNALGLITAQSPGKDAYYLTAGGNVVHDARGKPIVLDITPRPAPPSKADLVPR